MRLLKRERERERERESATRERRCYLDKLAISDLTVASLVPKSVLVGSYAKANPQSHP